MLRALCLLALLAAPAPAQAWGAQGHEIVAAIALRELTPAARGQVARLLGSDAMLLHDASWADEIRDQRPQTRQWHYVDIPLGASGYVAARDCPADNCVVAQIGRMLKILGDRRQPQAARAEALRFVVHFAGDIHQPLHAADNNYRGGNMVRVRIGNIRTNMHQVWDTRIGQTLGWDTTRIADDLERALTPEQRKAWQTGTPAAWANESFHVARDNIYAGIGGRRSLRLSAAWLRTQTPVVRMQLTKAGLRLAALLNATLK